WVDRDDDTVRFNTVHGHLKTRNLARDPRLSLLVVDPSNPFQRTLVVRGRAELVDEGADEHINRLARKYTGQDYQWRQPGQRRVTVRIHADHVSGGMRRTWRS